MQCPICSKFDKANHFTCPECKREYICGSHYDVNELVCTDCAEKIKGVKKQAKKTPAASVGAPEVSETAAEPSSPFYFKKISCPVCGSITDNRFFKPKIYSERKVDLDKHVLKFSWSDPNFRKYHPPMYLLWHCKGCKYTAEQRDFESPTKSTWSNFRILKSAFPEKIQSDNIAEKIVSWLSKDINYDRLNYPMAFKLHMLAIYVQEVVEPDERDTLKLGRYYIRAGWLLRELKNKNKEFEAEQKKLEADKKELEDKKGQEDEGKFKEQMERIELKIKEFEINKKEAEERFGKELEIITSIMKELKKVWKDFPITEEDLIKKSLEYLNDAYTNHPGIKNPAAAMDMLLWISGIYLNIGDKETGLTYLNNVIQAGQKQKTKIETRLKNPKISEEDFRNLSAFSKKISMTIAKARDCMQDIQYEKFKAQKEEAKKIYNKIANREPEEIRQILVKKGYTPKVIDSLVPVKKKKRFGIF